MNEGLKIWHLLKITANLNTITLANNSKGISCSNNSTDELPAAEFLPEGQKDDKKENEMSCTPFLRPPGKRAALSDTQNEETRDNCPRCWEGKVNKTLLAIITADSKGY